MAEEIIERFATGKGDNDIKIFCALCLSEAREARTAASGALAMLAAYEDIAKSISESENFGNLSELLAEAADADLEHRASAILCNICVTEGAKEDSVRRAKRALRDREQRFQVGAGQGAHAACRCWQRRR